MTLSSNLKSRKSLRRPSAGLAISLVGALLLSGCYLPDRRGGYAAPCELRATDGWRVFTSSFQQTIGPYTLNLFTRHLGGSLVEVSAYTIARTSQRPEILLDPGAVYLNLDGQRLLADHEFQENPHMQMHWRCAGKFQPTDSLNRCGPAVIDFKRPIPTGSNFVLHLDAVKVDGMVYPVPDIKFCYIPATITWVKFHG